MSVAGGLPRAVERAVVHRCDALQIFAKNANQWRGRVLPAAEIREFRARVKAEMVDAHPKTWENIYAGAGPEGTLLLAFKNPKLKPLTGKTLAEVAKMRGQSPEDTAIDLVIEDGTRVGVAYFLMSEENVRKEVGLPWMSFGSDEAAPAPGDHVPRLPTAVLSTGLMLVAFLSIACGLILDTVTRGRREVKLLAYLALRAPGEERRRS